MVGLNGSTSRSAGTASRPLALVVRGAAFYSSIGLIAIGYLFNFLIA
ncbi:MAG: hypothetical protein ABSG37_10875 [Candidatus Limnocylindrales bacterium]